MNEVIYFGKMKNNIVDAIIIADTIETTTNRKL